jgi:hypothetical protein
MPTSSENDTPLNPNVPGAQTENAAAPLGIVLGFITEFNANVLIFQVTALVLMETMAQITAKQNADIRVLKGEVAHILSEIRRLSSSQGASNAAVKTSNGRNISGTRDNSNDGRTRGGR